jgi:hypothetical protein
VTIQDATDDDPGGIEEGQYYACADGELVVRDLDGRVIARQLLGRGDDPLTVAKRLLRKTASRRPAPLVFPDAGYA